MVLNAAEGLVTGDTLMGAEVLWSLLEDCHKSPFWLSMWETFTELLSRNSSLTNIVRRSFLCCNL